MFKSKLLNPNTQLQAITALKSDHDANDILLEIIANNSNKAIVLAAAANINIAAINALTQLTQQQLTTIAAVNKSQQFVDSIMLHLSSLDNKNLLLLQVCKLSNNKATIDCCINSIDNIDFLTQGYKLFLNNKSNS